MQPRGPNDFMDDDMPGMFIVVDIGIPLVDGEGGVCIADMELLVCMAIFIVVPMAIDPVDVCEVVDLSMLISPSIRFAMGIVEEVWSISPRPNPGPA